MSVKDEQKPKPEDMLLRVIRVAEILVKGQDENSTNVAMSTNKIRTKTQTLDSDVR